MLRACVLFEAKLPMELLLELLFSVPQDLSVKTLTTSEDREQFLRQHRYNELVCHPPTQHLLQSLPEDYLVTLASTVDFFR